MCTLVGENDQCAHGQDLINTDRLESKLSPVRIHYKRRSDDRLIVSVGISGFEPEQTEPKSVVLPLHHIPIPRAKIV